MCGFAGAIKLNSTRDFWIKSLNRMSNKLVHRGPDDDGIWFDAKGGIGLSHRRLSIIDVSKYGHQPMVSASGRYTIAYNGEVYNFLEIKKELEECSPTLRWRGNSDTEVILAAIEEWGLKKAVIRFVGMFAFALWDSKEKKLHLVRDRIGIKPLYYGWSNGTFLFGSELKALSVHSDFKGEIDKNALSLYLRHNYIPAPYSIYKNIFKLKQGAILTISSRDVGLTPNLDFYWSAKDVVEMNSTSLSTDSEEEAILQLEALLKESVKLRMISDVPLGAFLSGGIDSSTVVSLMQAQSTQKVKTFSIGFYNEKFNEAVYAKEVADHLGTDHTELYVTPEEMITAIPKMPVLYDEPFSDSSQIPTYLVSELAKRSVTVSLSGDGGDELFAGYNHYYWTPNIWKRISWMPGWIKHTVSKSIRAVPSELWDTLISMTGGLLSKNVGVDITGDRIHKLTDIISEDSPQTLHKRLLSHWKEPTSLIPGSKEPPTAFTDPDLWPANIDFFSWMMYIDLVSYLPDDILVKVDRASMGVSLEARVPILDHRLVEFAWKLPLNMKVRGNERKWLLRQVLYRYVPKELIERPKTGFGVPISDWLRGPLSEWAEELLEETRLRDGGIFNPGPIREKWLEHKTGKQNWHYYLWDILMFQAWKEIN